VRERGGGGERISYRGTTFLFKKGFPPDPLSKNSNFSFLVPGLCLGMHGWRLRLPDLARGGIAREAVSSKHPRRGISRQISGTRAKSNPPDSQATWLPAKQVRSFLRGVQGELFFKKVLPCKFLLLPVLRSPSSSASPAIPLLRLLFSQRVPRRLYIRVFCRSGREPGWSGHSRWPP
jgi:hypothetical protein